VVVGVIGHPLPTSRDVLVATEAHLMFVSSFSNPCPARGKWRWKRADVEDDDGKSVVSAPANGNQGNCIAE